MYTVYKLKANELNEDFLASIKCLFHDKTIEIAVSEAEPADPDETAYLLSHPANRERLLQAIANDQQSLESRYSTSSP